MRQSQTVRVVAPALPAPARDKEKPRPGAAPEDDELAPRVVALLEDGTPGAIVVPSPARVASGRRSRDERPGETPRVWGELLWMPHAPVAQASQAGGALSLYDSAVASFLQPALVQLRPRAAADGSLAAPVSGVHVALRASSKGTLLVGVFNTRGVAQSFSLAAQSAALTALDLRADKALKPRVRGLRAEVDLELAPRGWTILAFGGEARALDEERFAARSRVRLR